MRRRQWRTAMLWVGCTLCLLIAVAFVRSAWWHIGFKIGGLPRMDLISGQLHIGGEWYYDFQSPVVQRHSDGLADWRHARWRTGTPFPGFSKFGNWDIRLPLYALFLAVAAPTLLVWRFWPKPVKAGAERRRGPNRGSPLLRVAKWGGTILSAACMIGSGLGTPAARYIWYTGGQTAPNIWPLFGGQTAAGIWLGSAGIGYASSVTIKFEWLNNDHHMTIVPQPLGWSVGWPLESVPWVGTRVGTSGGRVWGISSGFFAIMIGLPTALLWYLDRRHPPGHCPCGYDLTGNVSGTCPECGEKT